MTTHLHLAVGLDGYGWNPRAWQLTDPAEPVTSGGDWAGLAAIADAALFDTGGASAIARALNLDPHWRNAQTVASHNPLARRHMWRGITPSTGSGGRQTATSDRCQ